MCRFLFSFLLFWTAPLSAQTPPYSFNRSSDGKVDPASLNENFDYLANQIKQQKVAVANLTVNGAIISVSATSPICSSGGANPNITFCGSITESQVTNLVSDLAAKASNAALLAYEATVAASTTSLGGLFVTNSSSMTNTSSQGILAASSVTASSFFGDGSHLSGISAPTVPIAVVDNFLGQANGIKTSFTLSQTPTSSASVMVYLDGSLLSGASDYTYAPPTTVTITTAPATACTSGSPYSCTSGLQAVYTINSSSLPAVFILNSSQTASGANIFSGVTTHTQLLSGTTISAAIVLSTNGYVSGGQDGTQTSSGGLSIYAQSFDGATQSSGCIVAVYANSNSPNSTMLFTSTTTTINTVQGLVAGVLLESCPPLSICRVGIRGVYRVVSSVSGGPSGQWVDSGDRCRAAGDNSNDQFAIGLQMSGGITIPGSTPFWMLLK